MSSNPTRMDAIPVPVGKGSSPLLRRPTCSRIPFGVPITPASTYGKSGVRLRDAPLLTWRGTLTWQLASCRPIVIRDATRSLGHCRAGGPRAYPGGGSIGPMNSPAMSFSLSQSSRPAKRTSRRSLALPQVRSQRRSMTFRGRCGTNRYRPA